LANGRTGLLLVNLEDLWLEPLPQNVPAPGRAAQLKRKRNFRWMNYAERTLS
jgi:hypothetical protein